MADASNEPLDFSMKNSLKRNAVDSPTKTTVSSCVLTNDNPFVQQILSPGIDATLPYRSNEAMPNLNFLSFGSLAAMTALQKRYRRPSAHSNSSDGFGTPAKYASASEDDRNSPQTTTQETDDSLSRRHRNNSAAKRSRDNRRAKEAEIQLRAALLERENLHLKAQLNVLRSEINQLHLLLFGAVPKN